MRKWLEFLRRLAQSVAAKFKPRSARSFAEYITDDEVAGQILAVPAHFGIGLGCDLQFGNYNGASYATLGNIVDTLEDESDTEKYEASYLQQPDRSKRWAPGLIDEGEWKLQIYWSASAYTTAKANQGGSLNASGVLVNSYFKVIWNDKISSGASSEIFQGFIAKIGRTIKLKGMLVSDLTIIVSGPPTFTAAT